MAYLSGLDEDDPDGDVALGSTLDTELQDLKTAIQETFPNIDGVVIADSTDLYQIITTRSNLQTQLTAHTNNLNTQAAQPRVYAGQVSTTGVLTKNDQTQSWIVNQISTGFYQVVHNLGISTYATVITPDWSRNSMGVIPCCGVRQDNTSFTASFYWPSSTPPSFTDHGFIFHLVTQ